MKYCCLLFSLFASTLLADEFQPDQSRLPIKAPDDAIILFAGESDPSFVSMDGSLIDWSINDGVLVSTKAKKPKQPRSNHILSKVHFRDADIHVEFMLPETGTGNSGIYIHGHYELQIIDSHGKGNLEQHDIGAVYGFAPPLVNACRARGEWQVYDIRYRAPRRDSDGKITDQGSITAWLNGQRVQKDLQLGEPKSSYHPLKYGRTDFLAKIEKQLLKTSTGPVFLQDHDNAVRFRNVWIQPLDDHAHEYQPGN